LGALRRGFRAVTMVGFLGISGIAPRMTGAVNWLILSPS
jgi:hypothetical protein